jgi:poly-gamma-glutamate capsule biosynthesis protein CapA/YwtB (metallophosphatase superfamily)
MVKLLFLGDLLLSGEFLEKMAIDPDYNPFLNSALKALIQEHDVVIASLDGAMSGGSKPIEGDRIILETEESALRLLKDLNLSIVTLATNHAFDFGVGGFEATRTELLKNHIMTVGGGSNLTEASSPLITKEREVRLAFVAMADAATSAVTAGTDSPGVNPLEPLERIEAQLHKLRQENDVVIVLPHWGTEWYVLPSLQQRQMARKLIEAGADLIIGNHPHVAQLSEIIYGKPVFYALGNAVATDVGEQGARILKQLPMNLKSLAVSVHFAKTLGIFQVKVWDLFFHPDRGLMIEGEHIPSVGEKIIKSKMITDNLYKKLWNLYCLFMEVVFIPIRIRLMAYGPKYMLKRLNVKSVKRRLQQITERRLS